MLGSQLNWCSRYMERSMSIKTFVDNKIIVAIKFPKFLGQYLIYLVMGNQNYSDSAAHAALIARSLSLNDEDKRSTYDLTAYRH